MDIKKMGQQKWVFPALLAALVVSNAGWAIYTRGDRLHYARGIERINKKDVDGALEAFSNAVRQNPDDPSAHFGMGWAYQLAGRNRQSAEHYQRSIALGLDFLGFSLNNLQFMEQTAKNTAAAERLGRQRNLVEQIKGAR